MAHIGTIKLCRGLCTLCWALNNSRQYSDQTPAALGISNLVRSAFSEGLAATVCHDRFVCRELAPVAVSEDVVTAFRLE